MRERLAAPLLCVALLPPFGALACSGGAGAGAPAPAGASAATPPPAGASAGGRVFRVATRKVDRTDVTYTIAALGSVESENQVQVVAGVEGVVTSVRFREGDAVGPGTVLATIDPERYEVQADRARANRDKIAAQYQQALSDQRRREELTRHDPPLISSEEVERARQEAERLRASVAEADAQFKLAEQDRQRSIVRPLVPGIINSRTVNVGQHVESQAVLATLVDTRRLNLRFKVSEQESTRLREGLEVRFTTASRPGQEFAARVFHVSSIADPSSRMVECLARIEKATTLLKPGFFAEVKADVESHKDAIVVPERAVLPTEKGFVVFEVEDGKARERRVSLGLRTESGGIEILSGLGPDAIVITDGGDILRDGVPVQPVEPAAPGRGAAGGSR